MEEVMLKKNSTQIRIAEGKIKKTAHIVEEAENFLKMYSAKTRLREGDIISDAILHYAKHIESSEFKS